MEGKKEMLKEEMRQRKRERGLERRGGQDAVEGQRCVPPHPQPAGRGGTRSVRGDKVGGRGQREAEETESV